MPECCQKCGIAAVERGVCAYCGAGQPEPPQQKPTTGEPGALAQKVKRGRRTPATD